MLILNKIQLTGRVGRISSRDYQDKRFVTLRIAVPEKYNKDSQENNDIWFSIIINGNSAEYAAKWCGVGDMVYAEGRFCPRTYTDRNGKECVDYRVQARDFQIVVKKKSDDGQQAASTPQYETKENPHLAELAAGDVQDLPF